MATENLFFIQEVDQVGEPQNTDLTLFKKAIDGMVATSSAANNYWGNRRTTSRLVDYSIEEIEKILRSGSLSQQQVLSNKKKKKNGFYKGAC